MGNLGASISGVLRSCAGIVSALATSFYVVANMVYFIG
jgi:hypothetical protein